MSKEEFVPLLQEQQSSGLTVAEYCQIQSISPSTFNWWKQKYGGTNKNDYLHWHTVRYCRRFHFSSCVCAF